MLRELPQDKIQAWIERIPEHIERIIACEGGNEYKEGRTHSIRTGDPEISDGGGGAMKRNSNMSKYFLTQLRKPCSIDCVLFFDPGKNNLVHLISENVLLTKLCTEFNA